MRIVGVGLVYLYIGCGESIVYCDIKSINIFFIVKFGVKVVDFGVMKLIGDDLKVFILVKGIVGYLDLEYVLNSSLILFLLLVK